MLCLISWVDAPNCKGDRCLMPVNESDYEWNPIECYRQLVLTSFEQINASWITYNAHCNPLQFGYKSSNQYVENLLETYMEVYSGTKREEKFPKM